MYVVQALVMKNNEPSNLNKCLFTKYNQLLDRKEK